MDLFTTFNIKKFKHEISDELGLWTNYLPNNCFEALNNTLNTVKQARQNKIVYPHDSEIFRVFKIIERPEDIKVVIIGQDPYYNGNANGLAFGCRVDISESLKQIVHAIRVDTQTKKPIHLESGIDLEYLAKQGVFLLNTILTVEQGKPMSHGKIGWQNFTKSVIEAITKNNPKAIFMLWGKEAHQVDVLLGAKNPTMKTTHPASASYNKTQWKCSHFSLVNKLLVEQGKSPIVWF